MPDYENEVGIEIVARNELEKVDAKFTGFVTRAWYLEDRVKYITLNSTGFMADLNLSNYVITCIWWQSGTGVTLDQLSFSHGAEDQNEAFETLQGLLEEPGDEEFEDKGSAAKMVTAKGGPRRIEMTLKMRDSCMVIRDLVLTEFLPPKGQFVCSTVKGRIYKSKNGPLEKEICSAMNSDTWIVTESRQYPGGFSPPVTAYYGSVSSKECQNRAWERAKVFLNGLKDPEIKVLKSWEPVSEYEVDDEDDLYGYDLGVHYTQKVPQHYAGNTYKVEPPEPAMFRVRGDKLGELLYLETSELEVQQDVEDRGLSLQEYVEKKADAEASTKQDSEEASAVSSESGSVVKTTISGSAGAVGGGDAASTFCDCGSPDCLVCGSSLAAQLEMAAICGYMH